MTTSEKQKFEDRIYQKKLEVFGPPYARACMSNSLAPPWAQEKVINYMKNPVGFLIYFGSPGIGKTYLCASMASWAERRFGQDWRYWNENQLLNSLRKSMETLKGDYLDVLRYKIDAEFLMLDDVGSSTKVNEWREEIFYNTIDFRGNLDKPTLITSNFSRKEFQQKYHPRISSRLFAARNTIIEIPDGPDLRAQLMEKPKTHWDLKNES